MTEAADMAGTVPAGAVPAGAVPAGECVPPVRTGTPRRTARGYAAGKSDYLTRLRKIEGQVRGLQRMIENDTWCPDVVTQVGSVTRALQEVAVGLLSDHVRHCVASAIRTADAEGEQALDELTGTIRQIIRL
jgi:CsoR family transcriptional regulator, copper-sensing transcriptional repressor